jgi:hypothetical protein
LSKGDRQDFRCRDILSKVLNVPEYSGRVRGRGNGVNPTTFYSTPKIPKPSNAQLMNMIQELRAELHYLKKDKRKDMPGSQHDMHGHSDKDSSNFNVLKNFPEVITYYNIPFD